MSIRHRAESLARNLFRRSRREQELDAELRGYLNLLADEKIARGTPPEQAHREARIELGGLDQVKEEVRAVRTGALLEQFVHDLVYAMRGYRRSPAFTTAAIVSIALGVGANTAMFSVIDALLLRPLPVTEPERLVAIYRGSNGTQSSFSHPEFLELAGRRQVFSGAAAWGTTAGWLRAGRELDRVALHIVSPNYFSVVGVRPLAGTTFPETNSTASRGTAMVSERLWRSRFAADPSAVGRTVSLNGQPVTIIGIAPASFAGLQPSAPTDAWVTFATLGDLEPDWKFDDAQEIWLHVTGRLRSGVSLRVAQSAVGSLDTASTSSTRFDSGVRLVSAATPIFDPEARRSSTTLSSLLAGVTVVVLLIACGNVANLLVVRGAARRRELGVRLAIGASRGRVARQVVAESVVLCVAGCALAVVVAHWTVQAVVALAPPAAIPPGISIGIDGRIVAFAITLSLLTAGLFSLGPAVQASRTDPLSVIKGTPAGETGRGGGAMRLRRTLMIAQVALTSVLLIGAGLFLRTLSATLAVAPGYDIDRVLLTSIDFSVAKMPPPAARAVAEQIRSTVERLPGVQLVALGQIVPFSGAFVSRPALPEGQSLARGQDHEYLVPYSVVSEEYFQTLGMPLRGRDFSRTDTEQSPNVVIINETLARRYWPGDDAVGKRLIVPGVRSQPHEVIGVVADAKYVSLTEAQHPYMYFAWRQMHRPRVTLHVRTAGDPATVAPAVRAAVRAVHPDLPAYNPMPLADHVRRSIAQQRTMARLLAIFGAIALIVAAVGVYGLTAYSVSRRNKELAVRLALGARPMELAAMLITQTSWLVTAGLISGVVAAALLARLVRTLLFGVSPSDPATFAGCTFALALTTTVAAALAARRAARVDPLAALKTD